MTDAVALVTGGGRGIGRSTAELLARRGMTVVAVSRTEHELQSLRDAVGAEYIAAGIETQPGCEAIVEETLRRHGRVDVLVNNAGIDSGAERPIWQQDPDLFRQSLAVNLEAAYHLTRLVAGGMVERRSGRIVMVSSTAGQLGGPLMTAYCVSKHGLLGLMRAAAHDLAPHGVTCNAVCPGWVRTPMSEHTAEVEASAQGVTTDEIWRQRDADSPAGRIVTAEEVAETIAFLAGPTASGINGETITVSLGSSW
jgi:NAD(P)-dependent dehydrogenase (short-subunit alcohol dehydrogenase family)